jgi:hypothetical protein
MLYQYVESSEGFARASTNPYLMQIDQWLFDGSNNFEIGPKINDPIFDHLVNTGHRIEMVGDQPQIVYYCKHTLWVNAKTEALMSYGDPYWTLPCNWYFLNDAQKSYLKEKDTFDSTLVDIAEERWAYHKQEMLPVEEDLINLEV